MCAALGDDRWKFKNVGHVLVGLQSDVVDLREVVFFARDEVVHRERIAFSKAQGLHIEGEHAGLCVVGIEVYYDKNRVSTFRIDL